MCLVFVEWRHPCQEYIADAGAAEVGITASGSEGKSGNIDADFRVRLSWSRYISAVEPDGTS
jgi:hypothetical protein